MAMNSKPKAKKKSPIKIKPSKQGSLRKATGTPKGKNISESTLKAKAKSPNKNTKAKAVFALNAKQWKH